MRNRIITTVAVLAFCLHDVAPAGAQARGGQGAAVLSVTNGVQPISVGRGLVIPTPIMLLRESFSDVLKKNGTSLAAWRNACLTGSPACQQGLRLVEPVFVDGRPVGSTAPTTFDPVPPGSYYVFAMAPAAPGLAVWDLRVDLKNGPNSLRLDERNLVAAETGQRAPAVTAALPAAPPATAAATPAGGPAGPRIPAANAANAAPAVSAAPSDPSIAKARAAKVDTRVFGIELGEPLRLPPCPTLSQTLSAAVGGGPAPADVTCVTVRETGAFGDLLGIALPARDPNSATIQLANDSCPGWMSGCVVAATFYDGALVRVELATKGRGVEQATARELRGKYGAPTASQRGTVTPDVGNPFDVTDLEWTLPGLHVEYEVILHDDVDSTRVKIDQGRVRIETESEYQRRRVRTKETAKPKL